MSNQKDFATPTRPAAAQAEDSAMPDALLPDLDEGLNRLPDSDRSLLLARYFGERSYRELAADTGRTEAALMQQHHRALEKLARFFKRRGHAVTVTALAVGLSAPLTTSAPAGLAAGCSAAATTAAAAAAASAAASASGIGAFSTIQLALVMQIKAHLLSAAAVLLLLAGTASFLAGRWQRDRDLRDSPPATASASDQKAGASPSRNSSVAEAADPSAILADLPIPGAEEVLAAEGRERVEKLALWLTKAKTDALGEMLDKLSAMLETNTQRAEKELILQRWVELDPKGALTANGKVDGYTWLACRAWGRLDPKAAWAAAASMNSFEQIHIAEGVAESDPRMAREILSTTPDLDLMVRDRLRESLAQHLVRSDPRLGWEFSLQTGAFIAEKSPLMEWIGNDADAAISFALSLPVTQQIKAMPALLAGLNQHSPDEIAPLISSLPDGRLKWTSATMHALELARSDAGAAAALAQDPSASPSMRAAVAQSLAETWADSRPDQALGLLRGMDWTLTGDSDTGPQILTASGPSLQSKPSKAAAALQKLTANGHLSDTLEIAGTVPAGPLRDQAMTAVVNGWPAAQVMELSEWLGTQDSPSVRETGARKIVDQLMADKQPDFEAAASWAATLPGKTDPAESPLVGIMRKWREQDPEAASRSLKTLNIPGNLRAAIDQPAAKP